MLGGSESHRLRSVSEVEFVFQDGPAPFDSVAGGERCRFELASIFPQPDDRFAEFFSVSGVDVERVAGALDDVPLVESAVERAYDDGGLVELLVTADCPVARLATLGAHPRTVTVAEGSGSIVVEIPLRYDPSAIIETFLEDYPDAVLTSKSDRPAHTPLFARTGFVEALHARLTDRQREVIRVAFEAGYYEWPRRATGEEVAEELGISSATFSEHVHAAERRLLATAFEGGIDLTRDR